MILKFALSLIPSILYSVAYEKGGRDKAPLVRPRIWRRWIAPLAFTIPTILLHLIFHSFKWPMLLSIGTYIGAMYAQKYGGTDKLWLKILERTYSGLIVGLASLAFAYSAHSWLMFGAQIVLAISSHLVFGIKNPLKAEWEERVISFLTVVLVPFN